MQTLKNINKEIDKFLDKEVSLSGWIKTNRDQKQFGFIEFTDGTTFKPMQLVYDNTLENFEQIQKLPTATSIYVNGTLVKSQGAKQPYEIKVKSLSVINKTDIDNYPLQAKRHSVEFLRTIQHLRPRTNLFYAVFRVRSLLSHAIHEFFKERDFIYVHTPILTGIDAEGAGEMFQVTTLDLGKKPEYDKDFFKKKAFLTVTGQLHVETFCASFRNVYTFGPTFRSESSFTPRHAAEFWMIEPEMAFADLDVNMEVAEDMIKYIIKYVMKHAPNEIEFFNTFVDKGLKERLDLVVSSEFARVTYTDAIRILQEAKTKFENKVEWGIDLSTEHERYLAEVVYKKPVFVTDYPKDFKAFYMKLNEDGKTVRAMDLLAPGIGEIIGGSQREDDYEKLVAMIQEKGLNRENYEWYIDLRRFGSVPHSGFGLGFERILMYITGVNNIRDVLPFPRTTQNMEL